MNFSNDCKTVLFCFVLFPNQPIALVWLALHYSKPSQEYPKQGSRYRLTDAQVRTREEAGYLHSFSGFGNQWWKCQRIKKDIKVTWINWSFRTFKSAWFSGLFLFLNETINIYIYIKFLVQWWPYTGDCYTYSFFTVCVDSIVSIFGITYEL